MTLRGGKRMCGPTFFLWHHQPLLEHRRSQTTDIWLLDPNFTTAQNHIPIPNRRSCKMYENLGFLQKKRLSSAKSQTRDTLTKFEQIANTRNTLKHLKTCSVDLPNRYLEYWKKYHWVSVVNVEDDWSQSRGNQKYYRKKLRFAIVSVRLSSFYFGVKISKNIRVLKL